MNLLKKYVFAAAAAVSAISAFADGGYSIGASSGGAFTVAGSGGSYFQAAKDASLTFSVSQVASGASNVKFGVYTFDKNMNVISENVFEGMSPNDSFTVNFKEGDMIAFWASSDGMGGDSLLGKEYMGVLKGDGTFELNFNLDPNPGDSFWNTVIGVAGGASAPTGQPMPGVMATILAAGIIAAPFSRKIAGRFLAAKD